jgi:hypothetical protein
MSGSYTSSPPAPKFYFEHQPRKPKIKKIKDNIKVTGLTLIYRANSHVYSKYGSLDVDDTYSSRMYRN